MTHDLLLNVCFLRKLIHDNPNELFSVIVIRDVFQDILTRHSPKPRAFYSYITCVVVSIPY